MANDKFPAAYGQNREPHQTTSFGPLWFLADQLIKRINTATLVRVEAVTVAGQVGPVGQLDVTPLVKMVDGASTTFDHGKVRKIHYSRAQGGNSAIILDPKPGDIGLAVFCDRDTSIVRKTKKSSPPGSKRRFDVADGVYVMTVLGSAPTSYVRFTDDGWIEVSPDNGTTIVRVKPNEIDLIAGSSAVYVRPGRVDLGMKDAPHAVMTADGASTKVFAVIGESGP